MSQRNQREPDFDKLALEKGLPSALSQEKFILGSVLMNGERFTEVAAAGITADVFVLEKHKRIWNRMADIQERGEFKIDYMMVAEELMRHNELESVELGYMVSLTDGMPHIASLDGYIRTVLDKAALRRIIHQSQHTMNRALMAEESPDEILAGASEAFLGISGGRQRGDEGLMSAGDFLRGFPGGWNAFAEPHRRVTGLPTGFVKYDEMTGGLRRGDLTILAARPSMGKSALSMNIAWNIAMRQNVPVLAFALEMSRESLLLRMLCGAARIDSQRLRAGYLNEQERMKIRQARDWMVDAPIYIDDSSNIGLMEMHSRIRKFKQTTKQTPGLVIVDYLQLMARPGRGDSENADLTKLSRGLKLMAKEEDCPFMVLSQLSRASEQRGGDKKPQLSDLRGSGAIEQDADVVAFVHRAEVYSKDREDLHGLADLIIGKQRQGPIGDVPLCFLHAQVRFENRAQELGDVPDDNPGPIQQEWNQHAD